MRVRSCIRHVLAASALALSLTGTALAQEPEAAAPPAAEAVPDTPAKPKPRSKPKPKPRAAPKAEAKPPETASPELRTGAEDPQRPATYAAPPAPPQAAFAAAAIACDPGQSVLYDGPKNFAVWVTRSGTVTVDNPLRPLTPDITRVLQLVIGDRLATAYGRDLTSLRRGASPAALEGLLGGPIRWEARLGSLPDTLDIVTDSGAPLAQMRFKECGTAPAGKALPAPVARKENRPKPSKKPPPPQQAGSPAPASLGRPGAAPNAPSPAAGAPRQFNLPQGALSE